MNFSRRENPVNLSCVIFHNFTAFEVFNGPARMISPNRQGLKSRGFHMTEIHRHFKGLSLTIAKVVLSFKIFNLTLTHNEY